jgi:hypothetical protein
MMNCLYSGQSSTRRLTTRTQGNNKKKKLSPVNRKLDSLPRSSIDLVNDQDFVSGASEQGKNSLCKMPVGNSGAWLGTYEFKYGDDDTQYDDLVTGQLEKGTYGTDSIAFWLKSGMGFVGNWHAATGPFAGDYGSNLYVVIEDSTLGTLINGFFCFIDEADDSRTSCASEYYEVSGTDELDCPSYFKEADVTLDGLRSWAALGSVKGDAGDDGACEQQPVGNILAIIFGISLFLAILFSCFLYFKSNNSHSKVVVSGAP